MSRSWAKPDEGNAERQLKVVLPDVSMPLLSNSRVERHSASTRQAIIRR
jgi:hypothetical protein